MTRTLTRVTACAVTCLLLYANSHAAGPMIKGTIFSDTNSNSQIDPGEESPGVTVNLFMDDGDGIYDPGDQMTGTTETGADGTYQFDGLMLGQNYFVERSLLNGSAIIPFERSGLIRASEPSMIIDSFETRQEVSADPAGPVSTSAMTTPMSEVIGGERDLYVKLVGGFGDVQLRVNAFGPDVLQYDTESRVSGIAITTWDGFDASASPTPRMGLNGLDLTADGTNDTVILRLGVDAAGDGDNAVLRLFQGDPSNISEIAIPLPITDGGASEYVAVGLEEFAGGVDPSDVDAIQLVLGNGNASIDAQIDFVGVLGPKIQNFVVPEPATGSIIAMAMMLGFIRYTSHWRRRK